MKSFTLIQTLLLFIIPTSVFAQQWSQLEILDVVSGEITVVKRFDSRVEAPEWTKDGKYLYFNTNGRIKKISPDGGDVTVVDTGNIVQCNNDHVISPDGKFLAVSAGDGGKGSRIHVLPTGGGTPKLVTEKGPSYLHGWSPDGKTLVFTGNRGTNFDIYAISPSGENETQLTTHEGLDDGPEFSPDGKSIWFNSVRSGLMQIWKMNSDGTEQKQVSNEDANCWFPHVSPDGKNVVYLVYAKGDVNPSEHPANKNVRLCLIPAEGGEPKTLVTLYGGQGTINVNSWSPDSKRIAYIRYQ
ncbi:MAG: hypothetical protein LBU65_08240 [Planctomycetaceae bacterium]|nr:hypothetical protein [Planctomycetaceae bacterium]